MKKISMAALVLLLGACDAEVDANSDNRGENLSCGDGTKEVAGQCVPLGPGRDGTVLPENNANNVNNSNAGNNQNGCEGFETCDNGEYAEFQAKSIAVTSSKHGEGWAFSFMPEHRSSTCGLPADPGLEPGFETSQIFIALPQNLGGEIDFGDYWEEAMCEQRASYSMDRCDPTSARGDSTSGCARYRRWEGDERVAEVFAQGGGVTATPIAGGNCDVEFDLYFPGSGRFTFRTTLPTLAAGVCEAL